MAIVALDSPARLPAAAAGIMRTRETRPLSDPNLEETSMAPARRYAILMPLLAVTLCAERRADAAVGAAGPSEPQAVAFRDASRPVAERVADLVARMTLEEKVSQMVDDAPPIERLGVPAYNWWNECLHGVGARGHRDGLPAGDRPGGDLGRRADARAWPRRSRDEARAKHHEALRAGRATACYTGLTLLVAQHQHLPRPALGPRPGDLRRGPVPHGAAGRRLRARACRATTRAT